MTDERSGRLPESDEPRPIEASAEDEALFRAIAAEQARQLDPDDPRNGPFFDWLAREARARQTPAERAATETRAAAFASRWVARHQAEQFHLAMAIGRPPVRTRRDAIALRDFVREGRRRGRVPFLDERAAAGAGREIWDEPCAEWIARPPGMPAGDYLALQVAGDSMTPVLHDGDTILLKLGADAQPNTVVVARLPDDGYVVKQLARHDDGTLELRSLNARYAPLTLEHERAEVLGTVVMRWCAHGE